jgi:hypothetical protein
MFPRRSQHEEDDPIAGREALYWVRSFAALRMTITSPPIRREPLECGGSAAAFDQFAVTPNQSRSLIIKTSRPS